MFRHSRTAVAAIVLCGVLGSSQALAGPSINISKLKKAGIQILSCPKSIAHTKAGLCSDSQKKNAICIGRGNVKKAAKGIFNDKYVVDGRYRMGIPFNPVIQQEGDVQTSPFEVMNYPAIISYSIRDSNLKSRFQFSVMDAETGEEIETIFRARGEVDGELAWNFPGRYYLKINAFGDAKEELQPIYNVNMRFMDAYEGFEIAKEDLKYARVKTGKCPKQMLDLQTGRLFNIARAFSCVKSGDLYEAGFTKAPFNTGSALFVAEELDAYADGDTITLPFRVTKPRPMIYSVDDPSGGKGSLKMYLHDLATGKRMDTLVSVTGSITNTTTMINIPGDYFLLVRTSPSDPEENGEISWSAEIPSEEGL